MTHFLYNVHVDSCIRCRRPVDTCTCSVTFCTAGAGSMACACGCACACSWAGPRRGEELALETATARMNSLVK